jgi:hypothetical protein
MMTPVAHSSHLAQPLDLCVFGLFKIFYRKERQSKGMKGETRKIYRALLAFYKSMIIPMVRWSFERAGFHLNSDTLLNHLTVDSTPVLNPLDLPELPFDHALLYPDQLDPQRPQLTAQRRRQRIPGRAQSAINLMNALMRPPGSVLCVAMKKVSSPLMKKKTLIKSFAPDQIAPSYFLSETIEN